jgi:hypothetical protein
MRNGRRSNEQLTVTSGQGVALLNITGFIMSNAGVVGAFQAESAVMCAMPQYLSVTQGQGSSH